MLDIFDESPATLFHELLGQKADVFQSRIILSCPVKKANDFYIAFGMKSLLQVLRKGEKITPEFDKESNKITKALVFSQRPRVTDEEVAAKRLKKQAKAGADKLANATPDGWWI